MARYTGANCRLCRREGVKLFLKGPRCNTEKCSFVKRPTPPGMHQSRRGGKPSYYALQLREKQKAKRIYGMLERQFSRFFSIATKAKGVTGRKLLELLERRIDNVVYRAMFTLSRNQARQFVRHGFTFINARRVDIPSYITKENEIIEIKAPEKLIKLIKENIEINTKERSVPGWIEVDNDKLTLKITRLPAKEDISVSINEQLVVELYSK